MEDRLVRVGCDVGARGGLVVLDAKRPKILEYYSFITFNMAQILNYLQVNKKNISHINVEQVHSIFGVSAKSNFTFGKNAGKLECVIEISRIPFYMVPPKTWQKPLFVGFPAGMKAKEKSKIVFERIFADYDTSIFPKSNLEGLYDAALIGLYDATKG